MFKIQQNWQSLPTLLRYALPTLLGAAAFIAAGLDWKVVGAVILLAIWLQVVHWIAKSRPLLRLELSSGGHRREKHLAPLPLDFHEIVQSEIETSRALRPASPKPKPTMYVGIRHQAFSSFAEQRHDSALKEYAMELETWLAEYLHAADARYRTFQIPLKIINEARSSAAQDVRIILRLGDDARFVQRPSALDAPPTCPEYDAPPDYLGRHGLSPARLASLSHLATGGRYPAVLAPQGWKTSRDLRTATIDIGRVHGGEIAELDEDLYVEVRGYGFQKVSWTMSSAGGEGSREGELELLCPAPAEGRESLRRLRGILEYPDTDLEGDDGKMTPARTSDPPPPVEIPEDGDVRLKLRAIAKRNQREALGLTGVVD